jgi:methionyl aminopeptidase
MSIQTQTDLTKMRAISEIVGMVLREMREHAQPGMSTKELDEFGARLLQQYGANPAPMVSYGFPGWTCISVNHEAAHGIPSHTTILQEGDLVNVDVSAELDGYYADNGGSFILGEDKQNLQPLVDASRQILRKALSQVRSGMKIAHLGRIIQTEAKKAGYKVIKNLVGHGVGRSLHEEPYEIPNFYDRFNRDRFKRNAVVAVETFISTRTSQVYEEPNGWTYTTRDGSFVAQHEHTIVVTDKQPMILTAANGI